MRYLSGYRADDGTSSSHTAVFEIRGGGDDLSAEKEDRRSGRMGGIVSNSGSKRKNTAGINPSGFGEIPGTIYLFPTSDIVYSDHFKFNFSPNDFRHSPGDC